MGDHDPDVLPVGELPVEAAVAYSLHYEHGALEHRTHHGDFVGDVR